MLSIKFNDCHITNSPFAVHVDAVTSSASHQDTCHERLVNTAGYQVSESMSCHLMSCHVMLMLIYNVLKKQQLLGSVVFGKTDAFELLFELHEMT